MRAHEHVHSSLRAHSHQSQIPQKETNTIERLCQEPAQREAGQSLLLSRSPCSRDHHPNLRHMDRPRHPRLLLGGIKLARAANLPRRLLLRGRYPWNTGLLTHSLTQALCGYHGPCRDCAAFRSVLFCMESLPSVWKSLWILPGTACTIHSITSRQGQAA